MNEFCKDDFWSFSFWQKEVPILTNCFQNTVLVCIPSVFVLFGGIIYLCTRWNRPEKILPRSVVHSAKLATNIALIVTHLFGVYHYSLNSSSIAEVTAEVLQVVNFFMVFALVIHDRKIGIRSSVFLSVFWFCELIFEVTKFYHQLLSLFWSSIAAVQPFVREEFYIQTLSFAFVIIQIVLTAVPETTCQSSEKTSNQNPLYEASPWSLLFLNFFTKFVIKGYRKSLTISDLPQSLDEIKTENCYSHWTKTIDREKAEREVNLLYNIWRVHKKSIINCVLVGNLLVALKTISVVMLNQLVLFFNEPNIQSWKGYTYIVAIFVVYVSTSCALRWNDLAAQMLGIKVRAVLIDLIVRKSFRINASQLNKYSNGQLVNLLAVDSNKIYEMATSFSQAILGPFYLILSIAFLWYLLGPACLAGICILIPMTPFSALVASLSRKVQSKQMTLKDTRLKYISEVISSIKIVKFYGWELPFVQKIQGIRCNENGLLRKFAYLTATLKFLWTATPFFVALASFTAYFLINNFTTIDENVIFVSLALFNGIRMSVSYLPDAISNAVQTTVSIRRIQEFLKVKETDENLIGNKPGKGNSVKWVNATLKWNADDTANTLKNICLEVKKGELVAIVGRVGCAKSSLLSSMLGDLHLKEGRLELRGSVAYVPQQAWIQNATIKKNILFVKPHNKAIYENVLEKCCLLEDLQILPGGDLTEIGEKGINLSGGQKQRISLARAVYQNSDVYLLDDPLSAVDAHVGASLFRDIIGNTGLLQKKTRIFVTNMLSVLPNVDRIVVLKDGQIVEQGSYKELRDSSGEFSEFLKEHTAEKDEFESQKKIKENSQKDKITSLFTANDRLIDDETMQTGSTGFTVYKRYLSNFGLTFAIMTILSFVGSRSLDIMSGIWISQWSKNASEIEEENFKIRTVRILVYAMFGFVYSALTFVGTASLASGTITAAHKMHNDMLQSVVRAPMSFFDTTPSGRLLNRFGRDADQLDIQLPIVASSFLDTFCQLLGLIIIITINSPIFIAFCAPFFFAYFIFQRLYIRSIRQLKRMESVTCSPVYSFFSEVIQGLKSIKAYRAQDDCIHKANSMVDLTQNCSQQLALGKAWLGIRLDIISNSIIMVSNILVVYQRDELRPGLAGFLVSYAMVASFAASFIVFHGSDVESCMVASERVDEYTNIESEAPWSVEPRPNATWPSEGRVIFENFSTRYRETLDLVLKKINLQILPGEKVGVVGRTGAGKSSLTLSLFRIIEAAGGRLLIDGMDVSKLGLHDLRPRLTIIPQDPVIFSGNLRSNLDPNNVYSDEHLWNSLEKANIKSHFQKDGLDTQIMEGGSNLSVGQRQLICLVRAILQKRKILILDEATASVDIETDAFIQKVIRTDFSDCTVITIAHRLNTIMDSDRVIVMDSGNVIEQGPPEILLKDQTSAFYGMAEEAGIATLTNDHSTHI